MMKSLVAIATLATMTMAGSHGPKIMVDYDFSADGETEKAYMDLLALMEDVPTTIKFPRDRRARDGTCTGWTLNTATEDLSSFDFAINEVGSCKEIAFTVNDAAASYDIEQLEFTNDCGDGDETWTIMVQVVEDESA